MFEPIGFYHSALKYRFETPRQSVYSKNSGYIELLHGQNFETALEDLEGFSRIWLIFQFHLNRNWKPKVRPPVAPGKERIGVFATRSPHRPNPIGISCVRLQHIDGLKIYVEDCDLLDETPVFDVKPYIPAADSFPDARTGWLERTDIPPELPVSFSELAQKQADFLKSQGLDIENFCRVQLSHDPLNPERKRLYPAGEEWEIGCRTWRIRFTVQDSVIVRKIHSNYPETELLPGAEDRYHDKEIHRAFLRIFPQE